MQLVWCGIWVCVCVQDLQLIYYRIIVCPINDKISLSYTTLTLHLCKFEILNNYFIINCTLNHPNIYIYIYIYIHTYTYTYTYTYIYIYTYIHIYTYIYTHTHTYIHIHIYTFIYIYAYIHAHMHTCIHTYTHTHIHTYTHTHIHTYIHTFNFYLLSYPCYSLCSTAVLFRVTENFKYL